MKLGVWEWVGIVGLVAVVAWCWGQYQADPSDTSWTDPGQPPPMVAPIVGGCGQRQQRMEPYARDYPASLTAWSDCCVGDV